MRYEDMIAEVRKDTPKVRHFIHIEEGGAWMDAGAEGFSGQEQTSGALPGLQEKKGTGFTLGSPVHDLYLRKYLPA